MACGSQVYIMQVVVVAPLAVSIADDTSSGEVSRPVINVGLVGFTGIPSCCCRVAGSD